MDESAVNRWAGKSAEDVLAEVLHHLRAPVHAAAGALSVLKSNNQLSAEQTQQMIDLALNSALHARDVVNAVSLYLAEKEENQ